MDRNYKAELERYKSLLDCAEVGWWEADFKKRRYVCSEYLCRMLGFDECGFSFLDFYRLVREDFRDVTTTEFLSIQSVPLYEQVFPIITPDGEKWVRSRLCQRTCDPDSGCVKALGVLQFLPDVALKEKKIQRMFEHNELIFKKLYANLPVGVELYDRDGYLIDLNEKDMEIFGVCSKDDVLGINLFENPVVPSDIIEKLRTEECVNFRLRYLFKQVALYYPTIREGESDIMTKARVLYNSRGEVFCYMLINLDNTEQMTAYSRILEFENVFMLVSAYAKVGYALYDLYSLKGYAIKQWYENMGEQEGTPLSSILGVYAHLHPDDAQSINLFFDQVKRGEAYHFRKEIRVCTGESWKWICVNITRDPRISTKDKLEVICINYDITELKDTQRKQERAEELDRLKSAFLANMSHEIRTPLNAIVGFSQLLAETDDAEERKAFAEIINNNNQLLLQLISDILDLSKIESGAVDFIFEELDVKELVYEVKVAFQIKMPEGVELRVSDDLPACHIYSDHTRLTQVITNFLNNAIKYTTQGYIALSYELLANKIRFTVTDTGEGIDKETQAHIFDRFYKGDLFKQGTGLGLSICQTIVARLGGQIGVSSELGKGSTFWFTLPYSFSPKAKSPASPNPGTI